MPVGGDEKRAFTVLIAVANDGTLLPFQAIYVGKTAQSCPSNNAPHFDDLENLGVCMEYSGTTTYWSNHKTMRLWVDKILAPYFQEMKRKLGLQPDHRSLLQWDLWSVHRSDEMRDWMKKNHPTIILDYVPGGCTGLHQPCDVGIQWLFKHSIKRSYHEAVVEEMMKQIKVGEVITIDKCLHTLCDRSTGWLWNAFNTVNNTNLVKKVRLVAHHRKILIVFQAFEMSRVQGWNLSYESLTSFEARDRMRRLRTEDPEFWKELDEGRVQIPRPDEQVFEDAPPAEEDDAGDDSSVPLEAVIASVITGQTMDGVVECNGGGLTLGGSAEEDEEEPSIQVVRKAAGNKELPTSVISEDVTDKCVEPCGTEVGSHDGNSGGQGKRKKLANRMYSSSSFWHHNDNEASDAEIDDV